MNTIEYIIKILEEFGIENIFGISGCYNSFIIDSVISNSHMNWINCTNELNAGYAADGYARINGYGALITNYGSGELSAINAIAGAMAENVPIVNLVGIPSTEHINSRSLLHHNLLNADYQTFIDSYRRVSSFCALLTKDNAKIEIDRAFKIFSKEKKPIYLAIPEDIAKMEISDKDATYEWMSDEKTLNTATEKIAALINNAKRPIIIGDILIKRYNSETQFKDFCIKSGIPITNFVMGQGIIDNSVDNYWGCYFSYFANQKIKQYIDDSDCIIAVGTINSDFNSFNFNESKEIKKNIAIYGSYLYINEKKYDNIKMCDVLSRITKLVEHRECNIKQYNNGYDNNEPQNAPINSNFLLSRIQEFLKESDIVFVDGVCLSYSIAGMKLPNNINIQSQILWNSAGWATPAILGACSAKPNSRAILLTDNDTHFKTCIELNTILQYGYKPIVIVINNQNTSQNTQRFNFAKLARIFDGEIWATKVTTEQDFDKALNVTRIMNKLCYIEVILEQNNLAKQVQDIIKYNHSDKNNSVAEKSKEEKTFNYVLTNNAGSFGYETTVHKTYKDLDKLFNTEVDDG